MSYDGRIQADARFLPIADESVQCVVTSPPYWGLRDYGNSDQIGLESTPREYVNAIREVASELWRVLKDDGTMWLNLGDSYNGYMANQRATSISANNQHARPVFESGRGRRTGSLKAKDLVGIPWRVAFALQEDGWYLRSDVIWHKPNPMPESVTDRPTRAHEYLFLLAKSEKYFYDSEAMQEPAAKVGTPGHLAHGNGAGRYAGYRDMNPQAAGSRRSAHMEGTQRNDRWRLADGGVAPRGTRNKRSVWTVATSPYPLAHYAVFPPALIEPCILAGSRPGDFVLDPFAGSGTVSRVCEQYSRRWIGVDLGYQDLQEKRLRNLQKVLI